MKQAPFWSTNGKEFHVEASDLGWPPGKFLTVIKHDGAEYYYKDHIYNNNGELVGWLYSTYVPGQTVTVFND